MAKKKKKPKYSPKASRTVAKALHEFKRGELHSGPHGPVVKDRQQAIAIGLSQARRAGARMPADPTGKSTKKKATKKKARRKAPARKKAAKKRAA